MPVETWKKRLPMIATYSRLGFAAALVPLAGGTTSQERWAAALLFILGSITDWLDGYWARKYQAQSVVGQLMDPIADKILVLTALILLLNSGQVAPLVVILLMARDLLIGGLRSAAAANAVIIAAKPSGKWKTAMQMIAIPCLFIRDPLMGIPIHEVGIYGLWLSVVLSVLSGAEYAIGYYRAQN